MREENTQHVLRNNVAALLSKWQPLWGVIGAFALSVCLAVDLNDPGRTDAVESIQGFEDANISTSWSLLVSWDLNIVQF